MGRVAILIMWPRCGKQTFVPPAHEGSIWNLALIGPVVSEEKTFDECGQQTDGGACLYYYFTHEPKGSGELKITHIKKKNKKKLAFWGGHLQTYLCEWSIRSHDYSYF